MSDFKNFYPGVLGKSESKIIGDFVMRFLERNRVYFGELDFNDLFQECVIYFCEQKKRSWKKAEIGGMPYRAFVLAQCKNHLIHILRARSTWGRGDACTKSRFVSRSGNDDFSDSGDLEVLEQCRVAYIFVSAETRMIFQEAFDGSWKSLSPKAKMVFAIAVNENVSDAEIGRRLKLSGSYVGALRKKIREELRLNYSDCSDFPDAA
jgi:DNA-directed RNA polymerase specialized sigma24 family protein